MDLLTFFNNLGSKEKALIGVVIGGGLYLLFLRRRKVKIHFDGFVAPGFEKVAKVFKKNLESGLEKGADFAAYYEGNLVVDLWGGYADESSLKWRDQSSTSLAFSATKGVTAICLAQLVDRGLLDYKKPISDYWPEFGKNGKENITVETLLSHQAGLYALSGGFSLSMIKTDDDKLQSLLAEQKPFWEPGTKHGYHAMTFGLYCDQLLRRVDPKHRNLWTYFEEEIAIPYDVDFVIEEKKENFYRACRHGSANFGWFHTFFIMIPVLLKYMCTLLCYYIRNRRLYISDLFGNVKDWDPRKLNDPNYRSIPNGSSSGVGTARGLAKLYGILANGGVMLDQSETSNLSVNSIDFDKLKCNSEYTCKLQDGKTGKRLLKAETIEQMSEPLTGNLDHVICANLQFGRGFMTFPSKCKNKKALVFGHMGSGCQMGMCDPHNGLGWAYLTNYANLLHGFINDKRYDRLEKALYESVNDINNSSGKKIN